MDSGTGKTGDARHDLLSTVTALRLLVDGWRDGIVDASPGTDDGERLHQHVKTLSDLVDSLTPVVDQAWRR